MSDLHGTGRPAASLRESAADLPALLRSDPATVAAIPAEHLPALLAQVAALQAHVAALLSALSLRLLGDAAAGVLGHGRAEPLLSVRQAAERLGMSTDWLYRHAKRLPFTRRVGRRAVKFDAAGIDRWVATRHRG
jgi:excisionase family DNA binding protein